MLDAKARGAPSLKEYYREMGVAANDKYHPILRDERKLSTVVFDPQHVYFAGGVFEVEAKAFFDRIADADCNLDVDSFHEYMQAWTWPKCYATGKRRQELRIQCASEIIFELHARARQVDRVCFGA